MAISAVTTVAIKEPNTPYNVVRAAVYANAQEASVVLTRSRVLTGGEWEDQPNAAQGCSAPDDPELVAIRDILANAVLAYAARKGLNVPGNWRVAISTVPGNSLTLYAELWLDTCHTWMDLYTEPDMSEMQQALGNVLVQVNTLNQRRRII